VHAEQHPYLFTHLAFDISFNGPHVIAVNLTTDPAARVGLAFGKDLQVLLYTVTVACGILYAV